MTDLAHRRTPETAGPEPRSRHLADLVAYATNISKPVSGRARSALTICAIAAPVALMGCTDLQNLQAAYASTYSRSYSVSQPNTLVCSTQGELIRLNYLHDVVDCAYGPRTRDAIIAFQQANDLPLDGDLSWHLLSMMRATAPAAPVASSAVASAVPASTPWVKPAPTAAPAMAAPAMAATSGPAAQTAAAAPAGAARWVAPTTRSATQ